MSEKIPMPEMADDPINILKIRSADLSQRRQTLETEEATLKQEFKRIFAPAMIELKPSVFAIIKPSRRQGITIGRFFAAGEVMFRNQAGDIIKLTNFEDYIIFDDRHPLTPENFDEPFLAEILKELHHQE